LPKEKAELPKTSFGSSAIFPRKTRRFPPPSHGGFGFIGRISFVFEIQYDLIKVVDFVNMENQIVKIISLRITPWNLV